MPTEYAVPERESLTEAEAGEEILKLAKSFRASQGQTEDGESDETPNASAATDEPEEEIEAETPSPDESADEIEASDETTEEQPDEEVEPEPTPRKRGRTLKFDGQPVFVDEDEAYNGYLRQADYTRKTQSHSKEVQTFEKTRSLAAQKLEQYDAGLKQIEDALTVMMPQEPDWDRVRAERPTEYGALYTDWRRYQDRLSLVQRERDRVETERQSEKTAQLATRRKESAERLFTLIPEWRDVTKRDADRVKLSNLARDFGYDEDEIAAMEDPRQVLVLRDAMRYKDLLAKQASVKAQIGKAPVGPSKTARPGTPGSVTRPSSKVQAAVRRLAKSGNVDDAAEAIFQSMRATKPKKK